jgi:single-strand DNA-binding protein
MGNLTKDPELRHTPNTNTTLVKCGLAVNRKYKEKEEVMFIDITIFGKQAETFNTYTSKGSPVLIEGRLTLSSWEKDGVKHSKHEIMVDNFQLLGSRTRNDSPQSAGDISAPTDTNEDDDVPF